MNKSLPLVLIILLALAGLSFASSNPVDSLDGEFCDLIENNCPDGFHCSGPNVGLKLAKCCPLNTKHDLVTGLCLGECIDQDKDGFGLHCPAGDDCDDTDSSKNAGNVGSCGYSKPNSPNQNPPSTACKPIEKIYSQDRTPFYSMYGNTKTEVDAQLVNLDFMGHTVPIHKKIKPAFDCVLEEIATCQEAQEYEYTHVSTYNWRNIRDGGVLSFHSWAIAIDINPETNPMASYFQSDLPQCLIDAFKRYGFEWGGDWGPPYKYDSMHFEFKGDPTKLGSLPLSNNPACVINQCTNDDVDCDGKKDAICTARTEICGNNFDDDGDGIEDDGCCESQQTCDTCGEGWGYCDRQECHDLGSCAFKDGTAWFNSCNAQCIPSLAHEEVCNNFDDDNDGKIDEDGVCKVQTPPVVVEGNFLTYPLESTTNNYIISGWSRSGGHEGIDYSPTNKSETLYIVAAADGVVMHEHFVDKYQNTLAGRSLSSCIAADRSAAYGNRLKIKHDNGYISLYGHFKKGTFLVNPGDKVKRGQRLGVMGNTGCSTGTHLHFEIRNATKQTIRYDPYDIYGIAKLYPDRLTPNGKCGSNHLWTQCPPGLSDSSSLDSSELTAETKVAIPKSCNSCGQGVFNLCDRNECNGLGNCTFIDGFWSNSCVEKPEQDCAKDEKGNCKEWKLVVVPMNYNFSESDQKDQYEEHANQFFNHWMDTSPFNQCLDPSARAELLLIDKDCSNAQKFCYNGTSPTRCAREIISCARTQYGTDFDKAQGIYFGSMDNVKRSASGVTIGWRVGKAPLSNIGQASSSPLFLGSDQGGAYHETARGFDNGAGSTHELGHDFGLCHNRDPSASRPPDSLCPNNGPVDTNAIMAYGPKIYFANDSTKHLINHSQLRPYLEGCS